MADQNQKIATINELMDQLTSKNKPDLLKGMNQQQDVAASVKNKNPSINTGRTLPSNLPIIGGSQIDITALNNKNIRSLPATTPPLPQLPQKPTIKPPISKTSPTSLAMQHQSSIRTMKDDLESIKRGMKLTGENVEQRVWTNKPKEEKLSESKEKKQEQNKEEIEKLKVQLGQAQKGRLFNKPLSSFRLSSGKSFMITSKDEDRAESKEEEREKDTQEVKKGATQFQQRAKVPLPERKDRKDSREMSIISRFLGDLKLEINNRNTALIILGLVVVGTILFIVFSSIEPESEPPVIVRTPVPTATVSVVANDISSILGRISSFNYDISLSGDVADTFNRVINEQIIREGQFRKINIKDNSVSLDTSFTGVLDNFSINYPEQLKDSIGSDFIFLLYGQKELFNNSGAPIVASASKVAKRVAIAVEVINLSLANQVLRDWEPALADNFKKVFNLEDLTPNGKEFLDNTYKNVSIKYKNFNFPDTSFDYAIFPAVNEKNYLIFTNSREAMFATIDELRGL